MARPTKITTGRKTRGNTRMTTGRVGRPPKAKTAKPVRGSGHAVQRRAATRTSSAVAGTKLLRELDLLRTAILERLDELENRLKVASEILTQLRITSSSLDQSRRTPRASRRATAAEHEEATVTSGAESEAASETEVQGERKEV